MIGYQIERVEATEPYLQVHIMFDDDQELMDTASEIQGILARRFEESNHPPGNNTQIIAHERRVK